MGCVEPALKRIIAVRILARPTLRGPAIGFALMLGLGGAGLAGCANVQNEDGAAVSRDDRDVATATMDDRTAVPVPEEAPAPDPMGRSVWEGVYTEEQAERGRLVYARECASCHLTDLSGGGFAPPLVGSAVTEQWKTRSLGNVYAIIRTTMPLGAPVSLSTDDYIDVVAYLLDANEYPAGDHELTVDRPLLDRTTFEMP